MKGTALFLLIFTTLFSAFSQGTPFSGFRRGAFGFAGTNFNPTGIGAPVQFAPAQVFTNHGEVQLIGDYFNYQVSDVANAFDGILTNYTGNGTFGAGDLIGLHGTNASTLKRIRFAPGASVQGTYNLENYMHGVQVYGCLDQTFNNRLPIGETPLYPTQTQGWYPRYQFTEQTFFNNTVATNCWGLYFTNSYPVVAELQFIVIGTTNARPVAPVISPWGGRFTNGSVTVTLSSISTAASLYYTTNGSAPTTSSLLYSGPFSLSVSGTVNLQAIAYDSGLYTPYSLVSSNAFFTTTGWIPIVNWRDNQGNFIDAHGGHMVNDTYNGHGYLWYGDFCNMGEVSPNIFESAGTWCYQSYDLLNWTNLGQVSSIPSSATYHYRPKVLYNKTYNNYVMWEELAAGAGAPFALGVSTSAVPTGPFVYVSTNAHPWGETSDGDIAVLQKQDGTTYLFNNTNNFSGGLAVIQLDATYTNWISATATVISAPYREAPAPFFLTNGMGVITSPGNFYDSTVGNGLNWYYCTNNAPLGTWYNGGLIYLNDPTNYPFCTPTNLFNGQSAWAFPSPKNNGQMMLSMDYWYNGSTPLWDQPSQTWKSTLGTLYDSRQIWLPLIQTGPASIGIYTTNAPSAGQIQLTNNYNWFFSP